VLLLRERLESLGRRSAPVTRAPDADLETLAARLGGEVRENQWGRVVAIEAVLPMPPRRAYDVATVRLLGARGDDRLPERGLCFFDTETTGLSGGVGNQVFLAALGWRVPSGLLLRQYLLPDPAEEQAFLEAVSADIQASAALVTYNGRSFDSPVLEGRLLMSRRSSDCLRKPHLDLLHPARRLFKARLGSCSLQSVEAGVLGRDRGDDIPGYLIPQTYFDYLRRRDPEALRSVVVHNRQDVASLSLLLDHLVAVITAAVDVHPLDRFGAGRLLEGTGDLDRATNVYAGLWAESEHGWDGEVWPGTWSPVELAYVIGLRLATLHRRLGRPELGMPILEAIWGRHPRPWEAGIMLAKALEHRRKDRAAALEVATAVLETLEDARLRTGKEERLLADLRRRCARLAA